MGQKKLSLIHGPLERETAHLELKYASIMLLPVKGEKQIVVCRKVFLRMLNLTLLFKSYSNLFTRSL